MKIVPRSLFARTVWVVLLGLVISNLVALGLFYGDRRSALTLVGGRHLAERIAGVVQASETMAAPRRMVALRTFWGPGFKVTMSEHSAIDAAQNLRWDRRARLVRSAIRDFLGDFPSDRLRMAYSDHGPLEARTIWRAMNAHMREMMGGDAYMARMSRLWNNRPVLEISYQLSDGTWLNFSAPAVVPKPLWRSHYVVASVFSTILVVLISLWLVRRSTGSLALFARAAERLGLDVNAPALTEKGPSEVQRAARAFNEMQRRLQSFVRDRTHMLAAISHDLRTPITRLRLRAEYMGDPEQQSKMLADLEEMEAMISAALNFARDAVTDEPRVRLDLASLVQSACDDAVDAGGDVTCEAPDHYACEGRPLALKRMMDNLIANAVKYAHGARVVVAQGDGGAVIRVLDDGPGIPTEMMDKVFDPFVRVEGSRSRETGGVGLGLSAVRSIARAHGGEVALINRPEGGLEVRVSLPQEGAD